MVIIFNRAALYVACLSAVFTIPVALLNKNGVISEDIFLFSSGWLLFISDFICRKLNYDGKLFLIFPTWLITLGVAMYGTFNHFGIMVGFIRYTLLITLSIILLLLAFSSIGIYLREKQKIKDLHYDMDLIILPNKSGGILYYWEELEKLFFFPIFFKFSAEVYQYNIKVLETLKENEIEIKYTDELIEELKRMEKAIHENITTELN